MLLIRCAIKDSIDSLVLNALGFCIIGALWYLLYKSSKRAKMITHVNKLPGPPSYPVIGTLLPIIMAKRKDVFQIFLKEAERYGPLCRVWAGSVPIVIVVLPDHIKAILNNFKCLDKAFVYDFLHPWLGTGLLNSTGAKWHSHRKMITPTFHFKILENFVEVFAEKSKILVEKLKAKVDHPGFDIVPYVTLCTLDIICETAMGTSIHAQENSKSEYVTAIYTMSKLVIRRFTRPWLYNDLLFSWSETCKKQKECIQVLHDFTNKIILERKLAYSKRTFANEEKGENNCYANDGLFFNTSETKRKLAFLDLLLEASEDGAKLTSEELREEVDTFMFEGHDTTSAGISWAILLLGHHPEIQDKVYKELDEIFQGSDRAVTCRDLQEMHYLERVIKESLRLYPSVPFIGRKLAEEVQIGEYIIPAGTIAAILIFSTHRLSEYFPEPERFNPDNFLTERAEKRHPYAYIPFSAGPRNCIGQKFALMEMKVVLSSLFRHYKITSLEPRERVNHLAELILRAQHGIKVKISRRTAMAE